MTTLRLEINSDDRGYDGPIERPASLTISRVQEPIPRHNVGKIEVYDVAMTARIPTEFEGSYLIYKILGHDAKTIIVSPSGGTAHSHYYKPLRDLVADTGRSGGYSGEGEDSLKHTDEDSERFWILNNPQFRKELSSMGWLIFPQAKKVENYEQGRMGLNFRDSIYSRQFKLKDFIRTLELVTSTGNDRRQTNYAGAIRDFKELLPLGEEIEYVWEGGELSFLTPFFYMNAKHKDSFLGLRLKGDIGGERAPKTLARAVLLNTGNLSGDLATLAQEYSKQKEIKFEHETDEMISVRDRDYNEEIGVPNTAALLDQALDLQSFIGRVRKEEGEEARKVEEARLTERRKRYGLESAGD